MRTSHKLLLKYRHDSRYIFSEIIVNYIDRGAPGDCSSVTGDRIRSLDSYYLEIESDRGISYIPYHRIRKILYAGEIVWKR